MAKSMIVNTLGTKKITSYVPADATAAQAFADAVMDGETAVFEAVSTAGSDLVNEAEEVNVMIQNETSLAKSYLTFIVPTTKHEGDVISALQGKTINGVLADKVVVIGMRTVQY
jgi:hypothetical protein